MIVHEPAYRLWLQRRGVGQKDRIADSRASYVSYLRSTSEIIGEQISPALVSSERDVQRVVRRLSGTRSPNTIRNYTSALRQYAAMIEAGAHL